jgi:hypothetical protein
MAHDPRRCVLAGLCALAASVFGCSLDPRELHVRPAPLGDGAVAAVDVATARFRRAASAPRALRDDFELDADVADRPDAQHTLDAAEASSGAGGDAAGSTAALDGGGTDAGSDGAVACHDLIVSSAWIDSFANCLEIQGEAWVSLEGEPFNSHLVSEPVCLAAPAPSPRQPAVLGFYLDQASPGTSPRDYDARLHRVTGFHFHVSDYLGSALFPFVGVESQGEIYCMPLAGAGEQALRFRDLRMRCWETSSGPAPDPEHIRALVFYDPAGYPGDQVGVCVRDLAAIVESE